MNKNRIAIWTASVALLVALILVVPSALKAADDDSGTVFKLLSEARTQAFQLSTDAAEMESFTMYYPQSLAPETHLAALGRIKEDVNVMGRQLTKLEQARATALPWQKVAIDRITPLLRELAGNTTAAIEHLNKNPKDVAADNYEDYLEANADSASYLSSLIADFVDYGKTKARLERLTNRLEVEPKAK